MSRNQEAHADLTEQRSCQRAARNCRAGAPRTGGTDGQQGVPGPCGQEGRERRSGDCSPGERRPRAVVAAQPPARYDRPALESFKVGDVILGKYEVTEVLGQGGMGSVFAARNRGTRGLFALKVLLPSLRDDPDVCARFAREARAVTGIKNEHVTRVYDVDTAEDGTPFLVMEHLEGEDLPETLHRSGALPVEQAVDLVLQACEAVAEAHTLGIIHRDLKPANLFVTKGPSLTGNGASPDRTRGIALLEKGCKGGDDPACKELVDAGVR